MFNNTKRWGCLSEYWLNYCSYKYKKACNLGKLYFLSKIYKRLYNKPRQPVISNYSTHKKKASEFLDNHLKPIMQSNWSYIKNLEDFIDKIYRIKNIAKNAHLVTVNVIGLYPSFLLFPGWRNGCCPRTSE